MNGAVTRPVAVTRGLLTAAVVWGLGSGATYAVFSSVGAHTTIADVAGETDRVQIIWWGTHAFCACVAGLLGVALGGTALTGSRHTGPLVATLLVAVPVLGVGALALGLLAVAVPAGGALAVAAGAGLLTGILGGSAYVLQRGVPEDTFGAYPVPRRVGQSWGSR